MTKALRYPSTEQRPARNTIGGVTYDDPYQWLEEDTPEVLAWQQQQNDLARDFVRSTPGWEQASAATKRLFVNVLDQVLVTEVGGYSFRYYVPEGADLNVLEVAKGDGPPRMLLDLNQIANGRQLTLLFYMPSPNGKRIACGIAEGSSDSVHAQVFDVDSGALLVDGLPHESVFTPAWLPDGSGFYYRARETSGEQTIAFKRLNPDEPPRTQNVDLGGQPGRPDVSSDGRWAFIYVSGRPRFVKDLADDGDWQPFLSDNGGVLFGSVLGDRFVAIDNDGAPRGRVLSIPMATPSDRSTWTELVPESEGVIRAITRVGTRLVVHDLLRAVSRLRVIGEDGTLQGEIPLPPDGVMLKGTPHLEDGREEFTIMFTSLTQSPTTYRCDLATLQVTQLTEPDASVEDVQVTYRTLRSKDGTEIAYRILIPAGVDTSTPQPTIISAYGATKNPHPTAYIDVVNAAWLALGGIYVHAHVRGGGEFGDDWWLGGRRETKQNTYDDLIAIAEDLIARGETAPDRLGLFGVSNGGATISAVLIQRPDLFRAAVPALPIVDWVRSRKDPTTMLYMMGEYGDPDDPGDAPRLHRISPYHNVVDGTAYPAVFYDFGANDGDCPPWHGRKMVARLQQASSSSHPLLLRVREGMGHNLASDEVWIERVSEELAFFVHELALHTQ